MKSENQFSMHVKLCTCRQIYFHTRMNAFSLVCKLRTSKKLNWQLIIELVICEVRYFLKQKVDFTSYSFYKNVWRTFDGLGTSWYHEARRKLIWLVLWFSSSWNWVKEQRECEQNIKKRLIFTRFTFRNFNSVVASN